MMLVNCVGVLVGYEQRFGCRWLQSGMLKKIKISKYSNEMEGTTR